jgi:hypothetical protein
MRWSAVLFVMLLGLGSAACSGDDGSEVGEPGSTSDDSASGSSLEDDDEGEPAETTEPPETTEADDGGESAGGVEGYCDAVDRYIEAIGEAIDDPSSAGVELQEAANAYAEAALELGELSPGDQARFDECSDEALQAATDLGG